MPKFQYAAPGISLVAASDATPPRNMPSMLVVLKGHAAPEEWARELPAHLNEHGAWKGDLGARFTLHSVGGVPPCVVFGAGKLDAYSPQEASEHGEGWGRFLQGQKIETVRVFLPAPLHTAEKLDSTLALLKGMLLSNFRVTEFRSKVEPGSSLKKIEVAVPAGSALKESGLAWIRAVAQGVAFSRSLIELPGSTGTPAELAARFKDAIDPKVVQLEVWDEKRLAKEKMGLILAVGQGSEVPPRFLVARYGKEYIGKKPLLAFVGKGVTFDTGGINLKTADWRGLIEMKKDMGGAAGVLGAMVILQHWKPKVPVIAVTPLTFNKIDAKAVLPGDVIRSYSGKTVEIQNTDAEGRLILADAIHYALEHKPDMIVDVATLTGACVMALGTYFSGCFTNRREVAEQFMDVAERCGEPAWLMPTAPRYSAELKSEIADLPNMGKSRDGGASIGAVFLQNFVGETPWVHMDIAGTVDLGSPALEGSPIKGAGRMAHTLAALAQRAADGELVLPPAPKAAPAAATPKKKR